MADGMDKNAVRISKIDQVESDFAYWQVQSHEQRLRTVEEIRREYHGWPEGVRPYFKEFVGLLNARDARFLVVGGYASPFTGIRTSGRLGATRIGRISKIWSRPMSAGALS